MKENLNCSALKLPNALYICSTPIGNLSDCSFRLLETLKSVDLIAAEDTRIAQRLLTYYKIKTPLISLQKFNEKKRLSSIISRLKQGQNIAVISDAGTPNISDPGALLIEQIQQQGFPIIPIPGPSAVTAVLSISGILANQFYFFGYFPRKETECDTTLTPLLQWGIPIVFFETAKRLLKTLTYLSEHPLITTAFLAKEMTKKFESYFYGPPSDLLTQISKQTIKGEWCLVIKPHKKNIKPLTDESEIKALKALGLNRTQFQWIAEKYLTLSKNESYQAFHS